MERADLIANILEVWKNDYNDNADSTCVGNIINFLDKQTKEKDDTIALLENRLKGFKLHYCIDELREENKNLKAKKLDFTDWFCHSGYIMRPFPEESGVYLFDNHNVDNLEELYENPKTLNELYYIFEQNNKTK